MIGSTYINLPSELKHPKKGLINIQKEDCLIINGKQNIKLEKGFISFKNYFKQIPVPFKIYAGFECILKKVDSDIVCSSNSSYTKKISRTCFL